jgi:hypothetical protein
MNAVNPRKNTVTLEINGPEITADVFGRSVRLFFDLINDVAVDVAGKPKAIQWMISVEEGSIGLCATARSANGSPQLAGKTVGAIRSGIEAIGQRKRRPAHFSDNALTKLFELGNIPGLGDQGIERIGLKINQERCELSPASVAYADELLGTRTSAYGTVEGDLLALNVKGRLRFSVYETLTGREVKCFFGDEIYNEVIAAIKKRVSAYGLIRYRKNGQPASLEIEKLTVFPEQSELPQFEDIVGLLKD